MRSKFFIIIGLVLPMLFVFVLSYFTVHQYIQPPLKDDVLHIPNEQNKYYQLKYGWSYNNDNEEEASIVESTPFTLHTEEITTFTTQLLVPKAGEIYSLNLQGIQHPFELWVNDQLVKESDLLPANKLISFYVDNPNVTLKLVITPTTDRIAILQSPLFGEADHMQDSFIRNLLSMLATIILLMFFGINSIVLYFSKQRQKMNLQIGIYFLLIGCTIFLSSKGVGTIFLPYSPNIMIKVKTISAVLAAIPLYLFATSFFDNVISKKKLCSWIYIVAFLIVLIIILPFEISRYLELIIWLSLVALILIISIKLLFYYLKNKSLELRNLMLANTLFYLFGYLILRIYYNIWGTDIPTNFWLIAFAISICLYITLYQNHLLKELSQSKQDVIESRISFFNAQIKPHFIYNALSNIIALCYTDSRKAAYLLGKFSTFLRLLLENNKPTEWITLDKELTLIDAYVEIEKARFSNKISYELQVDEHLKSSKIPPLTIQPLVENAIRHGLFSKIEHGTVHLTIKQQQEKLVITIQDDGVGMTNETVKDLLSGTKKQQGIGILNVVQRLQFIQGSQIDIQSKLGAGTCVILVIPHHNFQNHEQFI